MKQPITDSPAAELPYGDAFRFVEKIVSLEENRCIETEMFYSRDLPMIDAHFRDGPKIVPGVILIEQISQSALLLGRMSATHATEGTPYLGQIRASFLVPCARRSEGVRVRPDRVDAARSDRLRGGSIRRGAARVQGERFCGGETGAGGAKFRRRRVG